ncbi:putative lactam utilization protein B-like protein [Corynebacterium mustelae]|uniref:5-oxoprolinase subunit A n=1 Tax=Corynebacterium mustelae TaxID=571915 RepID=A0A0G3H2U9_9CORY|nr:5-oxoprolinase subunit PxpA [Corynebacterium mustelae]AKK05457.1 putative lactam utilization protein B-like protein [Corynebacterium mustelae]
MAQIDLNADLGESFGAYTIGNDTEVLKLITSANIACGFHAGDPQVMLDTTAQAIAGGVRIGAHPGYRDLSGFGRRTMIYSPRELTAEIIYQIGALQAAATASGGTVEYVKPHGALYNTIASDKTQAMAVIEAIAALDQSLSLMVLAASPIVDWARSAGLSVIEEVFADRAYNPDGSLVSRSLAGAVHHDPEVAAAQAVAFATRQPISTIDGTTITLPADSLCVHGDNPQALALIDRIRTELTAEGVSIGSGN